jgi:hypothetical protein
LVINQKNSIPTSEIKTLETNINKIFTYFKNNQNKLWDKEKESYTSSFSKSTEISNEYFAAINNYEFYSISKTEIQDKYFADNENTKVLSIDSALKYLQGFNYINLSNIRISLRNANYCNFLTLENDKDEFENPYCYKIENFVLNNRTRLDFILVPSNYNEISHIIID